MVVYVSVMTLQLIQGILRLSLKAGGPAGQGAAVRRWMDGCLFMVLLTYYVFNPSVTFLLLGLSHLCIIAVFAIRSTGSTHENKRDQVMSQEPHYLD